MLLLSWNVNGVRAAHKKGLMDWFYTAKPDILCIQETKASEDQIPMDLRYPEGYETYFASPAGRTGYSGVGLITKPKPDAVEKGIGVPEFDREGRILKAEYPGFTLFNVYFPNGGSGPERLSYKLRFYDAFLEHVKGLERVVVCGDVNTAHKEADIARPKENLNRSGFMPVERAWLDKLLSPGFTDTFRLFNQDGGNYTWWDMKTAARDRNVGWRLDYFFVSEDLRDKVKSATIHPEVTGSDHCPIGLELSI